MLLIWKQCAATMLNWQKKGKLQMESNETNQVMTVSEVAAYLRMADSTVYRLVKEGKIPGRKVGGGWRFSRKVIDDWLANPSGDGAGKKNGVD